MLVEEEREEEEFLNLRGAQSQHSNWLLGTLQAARSLGEALGSLGTDKATVRKKTR